MNKAQMTEIYGKGTKSHTSPCDICSFGCPVSAYVKNGELMGVAPDRDAPTSRGFLCAKGYASRQYVYRPDRIRSPMKRVGERGEGKFQQISWERAFEEIASKLNGYKAEFGPDSVAFFSGYTKWYRPFLHRLAHSFGTLNYGTESSSCFQATVVANKCSSGCMTSPDAANAGTIIGWAYNNYYSNLPTPDIAPQKKRGAKIIIVDPKLTPAARLADLHLRPKPGTDGALALGIGRELIKRGLVDRAFIEKYVVGFDEYAEYVEAFTPDNVNIITGVPPAQIIEAVDIIEVNSPLCLIEGNAGMIHHKNGVQAYRAVNALIALTGGYVKKGGNRPFAASDPATDTILGEKKFINQTRPINAKPKIGTEKYPLWSVCIDEYQAMELAEQIQTAKPYPIKAVFALGMNARLFPNNQTMFEALKAVDFFVDADIFMSDTAKYADILLPACTSFEREELRAVGTNLIFYKKAIEPLYDSRSDADIVCSLAKALNLDDELLSTGVDACWRSMLDDLDVDLYELKKAGHMKMPPKPTGEITFYTKSGKYELYSSLAESFGYEPLPKYYDAYDEADPKEYPLMLCSGGRLPNAFASRMHGIPWTRELRKKAAVDISIAIANKLDIKQGDIIKLTTSSGSLVANANITNLCLDDMVCLYHGYSEADVNTLIPKGHNDPYSGFPGYRSVRCKLALVKRGEAEERPTANERPVGVFTFDKDRCTGCGACVVACMEKNNTDLSTAKPLRHLSEDLSGKNLSFDMEFCGHCLDPDCQKACKFGSITRDALGLMTIDKDKCVSCFACQKACKLGGIQAGEKPYKCDGCRDRVALGLDPVCVEACRFDAIEFKATNSAAVILAGGKSSRMGKDKAGLKIGDETFLERLVGQFGKSFNSVFVSVSADSPMTGSNVIHDMPESLGPLSGLYAAFKNTDAENVFICAVDMPFADPKLALCLVARLENHEACLFKRADGQAENAFCVFSRKALPKIESELNSGSRSVHGLLKSLDALYIDEGDLPSDLASSVFSNINTPEDYEKMQ